MWPLWQLVFLFSGSLGRALLVPSGLHKANKGVKVGFLATISPASPLKTEAHFEDTSLGPRNSGELAEKLLLFFCFVLFKIHSRQERRDTWANSTGLLSRSWGSPQVK